MGKSGGNDKDREGAAVTTEREGGVVGGGARNGSGRGNRREKRERVRP